LIEEDGKAEYIILANVYGLSTSFSQAIGFTQEQASNVNRFRKKYMMDTGSLGNMRHGHACYPLLAGVTRILFFVLLVSLVTRILNQTLARFGSSASGVKLGYDHPKMSKGISSHPHHPMDICLIRFLRG
jgi:hypothetical protein